ncbi:fibronectin type III domain-containing protein [Paenibacillus sp. OK076]|uniref:fibronectin type III domain-containing protein n=1 Tax=Paenibacillus sp. OK076 TaxID=1884379 RepID=UPI0008CCB1BD|nr:fibronectin type III domain-containing protein [Paenibacillus sp. OK076]SEN44526.1 Fibronectin type III domain-containing protein [Paenibacillus sp. OK076]
MKKKSEKRIKKQAEQLSKVVLAFALLSPQAMLVEWGSTAVMAEAVETISIVSDTSSMKAVQSSKVKVEMNSDGKYRIVLLPNTNVFYGGDTGNVSTIIDHNGTPVNFKSLPLNYYRINNNVIEMSRQKDNVEYILRVSIVNATSQGGYMKVELEAVNRSGSTLNLGGTFYWDTMVNGNDASPFEVIENGWRNYSGGVQVTAFYANTYNVVDADRIFMGQYNSPDSAQLTGGSSPSSFTPGQTITATDTAAQFWWDGKATANQASRKFSTIVGIGPKNAPPSFALSAPSSGQTYYKGEQLQISGTTRDTDVGDLLTVKWSIDGGSENMLTQMTATGSNQLFNTNYTLPDTLADGAHTLQVWVMDDKGGVSSAGTVNFTVKSFVVPGTPTFTSVNNNNLTVNWDKKANDASVTYELKNVTTNQSFDTGTSNSRQVTGLTPNTPYSFAVRAKNSVGSYTGYSSPASKFTLANTPSDAAVSQSGNSVTASWNNNGNPAGTNYKTEIRNSVGQVFASGTTSSTRTELALTGLADGIYDVYVAALNGEGIQTAFASAGQITKDTTGPTAPSLAVNPFSWTKEDVLVTITAGSDALSGVQKTQYKLGIGGEWKEYTVPFTVASEGNTLIIARSIDAFGNTGQEASVTARVDRTAPTPPVISLNPPEWTHSAVTVTLTAGTDEASGVGLTQYRLGGEGTWVDYREPFTIHTEGITEIQARSVDRASNVSASTSATARIDKTGPDEPKITLSDDEWTNQDVSFEITSGEDTGSGLAKSQYRLNEQGPWIDYTGEVKVTKEGKTTVYARSLDQVGNVSTVAKAIIRLDKTAPTEPVITLSQSGWSKEAVQFTIAGSVDEHSISYEYSLNGAPYIAGNSGTVSSNGPTVIRARARDAVGNVSKEISRTAYVDQVAPTVTFTPNGQGWSDTNISATVQYEDSDSGINENSRLYNVTNSSLSPDNWNEARSNEPVISIESEGIWYIHAKTMDVAGNTYETVSAPYQIQRKPQQPGNVSITQISETSAELTWDLPTGEWYTDGYQYEIINQTTGQLWTLDYPKHTHIDDSLSGGQVYDYEVRVRNHTGISDAVAVRALTIPAAPASLQIRKVDSQPGLAEVHFDSVQGATAYRITAATSDGRIVYDQTISDSSNIPYLTNLVPGSIHTISVTALNESGAGESSRAGFLTLPAAPGEFEAVQIREHEISLGWETVTSATYYSLSRSGAGIYEGLETEYVDAGLDSGTEYSYELLAANETGEGPVTSLQKLMTLPGAIENLSIDNATTTSMRLSWDPVRGAERYEVFVNGEKRETLLAGTHEYLLTGLTAGTLVQVDVQAGNGSGQGQSNRVSGTTLPESPSGLHFVQPTETGATLRWDAVPGATKYRVVLEGQSYEISDTQLEVHQLSGSRHYTYQVQAGNAAGYGAPTSGELLTLPTRPEGLTVTHTDETSIGVEWESVNTAESYIVSINGAEVGRTSGLAYTAEELSPGMEYLVEVQGLNTSGVGQSASLIRLSKPASPSEIVVEPGVHKANLSWAAVAGASEYVIKQGNKEIYRGTELTTLISGLEDGTMHHYALVAMNRQGTSSEATNVSVLTLPEKPVEIKALEVSENSINLDFTKTGVKGADEYIIERNGREIARMDARETQFVDEDLLPGTKYTYKIRAVNASGSGASLTYGITTQTLPLSSDGITVIKGTHAFDLAWEAVKGAAAYEIRNQTTGEVQTVSEPSVHLASLLDGTTYAFELTVMNEDGHRSSPVQVLLLTKPISPQTASIAAVTDQSAKLDLSGSATRGAEQLIILRDGIEIDRIPADSISYEDSDLTPGERYTYTVKTSNASGDSDTGFDVQLRTLPATIKETLHPDVIEETAAVIKWKKVQGAEGYIVMIADNEFTTITENDLTEVTLNGLTSAAQYDQVQIVPYNTAGKGSPMVVAPFFTLPHVDSVEIKLYPETEHARLEWDFPYLNETFVVLMDGIELYRGKQKEYIVNELQGGTNYSIELYTENEQGDISHKLEYTLLTKPEAPKEVEYRSTQESIQLQFEKSRVKGAEQFIIERDGAEIGRVSVDEPYYEDRGLESGVDYVYTIKTVNASGKSEVGFNLTAVTLPGKIPSPPQVEERAQHGADIVWDMIPGAAGYRIYRKDELIATTMGTSIHVTELESAQRYPDFSIVPFNEAGDGETVNVPEFETLPSEEFTVSATSQSTSSIALSWKLESLNEIIVLSSSGREIYRGKDRSYIWTGLTGGQRYDVILWTENSAGEKSESQQAVAVTMPYPPSNGSGAGSPVTSSKPEDAQSVVSQPEQNDKAETTAKKEIKFIDIGQTFNKDQIIWLAEQNIIQGVSETRFEPRRPITRAEFTALIVRLMGVDTSADYQNAFQDVNDQDWFAPEIEAAVSRGMVHGMGNGKFAPYALVTREQASKIIANVIRKIKPEPATSRRAFTDQMDVSDWAKEEVEELAGMYMLTGYQDGSFRPLQHLSRSEAAALIFRLNKLIRIIEENQTMEEENPTMDDKGTSSDIDGKDNASKFDVKDMD